MKGLLYYAVSRHKCNDGKREWRQVPRTQQDINRILHSCHDSLEGTCVFHYIFYFHSSLSYKYEILLSIQEGIWAEIKPLKKFMYDSFGNPCGMMCWSM